ncbi:HD domain-containing protein [Candidatus Kaiserbacteria bacterium]|nr:HD domain-containing protein [Candidatus Kaiserbacteria bacterium]
MNINDKIYGTVEVSEPVLLEILNGPSLERLKDIDQFGYFTPYAQERHFSRFEHSVGVFLLLQKYGASLEEQVAGLIHDVSHSAFSHCVDYVLAASRAEKQEHQDSIFDTFVRRSELPAILEKRGFETGNVLDDSRHPLKETQLPDLCADRIDYTLRDICLSGEREIALSFLDKLSAENGRWIFMDYTSAREFAERYAYLNKTYWAGVTTAAMFYTVGEYLKHALSKAYILENDLYTTDTHVLAKIAKHHSYDTELMLLYDKMNNRIPFKNDPTNYDAIVKCKSRAINPLCRYEKSIKRVSEVDPAWLDVIERESKPKVFYLKFER